MKDMLEHSVFGFCWWDIPACILLIVVIAVFAVQHRKLKKIERELEDQLSSLYADNTV